VETYSLESEAPADLAIEKWLDADLSGSNWEEDLPVDHYTLKHRLTAWISIHLFDRATYTVRNGLLEGMKRKGGLGWLPAMFRPRVLTAEEHFWSRFDFSGLTVYDVGAFQGLLTLFFAARAKAVVSFEPNSLNHRRLMENLNLNGIRNVDVRKAGVGSRREKRRLVGNPLMPGGSRVDGNTVESEGNVAEDISIVTLDEEIPRAGLAAPDFVKIDTEGWEMEALRGARHTLELYRPVLFLEMHGETMREKKRKAAEIVAYLWKMNYRRIRHIETSARITPENSAVAMRGHLFCEAS